MKWMMCLGVAAMLGAVGCDSSKQELESTQSTLASVTKERDDLKAQLTTAQQQLATAQAELAKAKPAAPATAAATAKPSTPEKATPATTKSKHAHKS